MNFRDHLLTCATCGKTFIFTVTEQRQLHKAEKDGDDSGEDVSPAKCPACRLYDSETGRWSGRVKWFNFEKGYGFIVKPDGGELFFHRSHVVGGELASLDEGTEVTFEQVSTDRGGEARDVRLGS